MGNKSESSMVSLWIFVLVLNLIFPVIGYTFTAFGNQAERYELALDADSIMAIGLNLVDGESHNLTWKGDHVEYGLLNDTIRVEWDHFKQGASFIYYDGISFFKQSTISKAFDTWFGRYTVAVKSVGSNEWFYTLRNETIVRDWDLEYNWSRFVLEDGHHVFITPYAADGNITKAVYEDGNLNVTLAKSFDDDTSFNFWRFIGWYTSLLLGDQSWGLPSMFSWVIRILGALSIFAAIMLARRMIPL